MVLDSGPQSYPQQHPDDFGNGLPQRRGGKKGSPCNGLRLYPFLSPSLSLESDSSSPAKTTRLPLKASCLRNPEPRSPLNFCPAIPSPCSWMRRSESTCAVNRRDRARGQIRSAASLPHIPKAKAVRPSSRKSPCLLVALRPLNIEVEREKFFQSCYSYNPQFQYEEPLPEAVLEKYKEASGQFISQVKTRFPSHTQTSLSVVKTEVGFFTIYFPCFPSYSEEKRGSLLPPRVRKGKNQSISLTVNIVRTAAFVYIN